VAVADVKSGLEDSTITGTVATNDSDVDDGAVLSYSLNAPVAGLSLNSNGSYSFDASNAAYQHLAQGATTDVVANYTVTDEHGATSISTLTITLTGTNDAPVAVADVKSGLEDSTITGTVATNDSDVDDGAVLSYSLNAPVAGLSLNSKRQLQLRRRQRRLPASGAGRHEQRGGELHRQRRARGDLDLDPDHHADRHQ